MISRDIEYDEALEYLYTHEIDKKDAINLIDYLIEEFDFYDMYGDCNDCMGAKFRQ